MEPDELYEEIVLLIADNGLTINTKGDEFLCFACREICDCIENDS